MLLVDERGRVDYANAAALAILHRQNGVRLDKDGRVRAANRDEDQKLRSMIASACKQRHGTTRAEGDLLRITRSRTGPLMVTVAPVPAERFALGVRLAFVCLEDVWQTTGAEARKIAAALNVTPAEARLVATLSAGVSLRQAAAALGIAYDTARTQLRSVLEKSGIHRQAELMLRVGLLR
jgi:DNA-binding CsgD family transcriptional regulator